MDCSVLTHSKFRIWSTPVFQLVIFASHKSQIFLSLVPLKDGIQQICMLLTLTNNFHTVTYWLLGSKETFHMVLAVTSHCVTVMFQVSIIPD